jgi:hypothetical protein
VVSVDPSIILSIVAIAISIITLVLAEFHGPNISVLSSPKNIEISDEGATEQFGNYLRGDYMPSSLRSEPFPLVFANHGDKSGTILNLHFEFSPIPSFQKFIDRYYFDLGFTQDEPITPPMTIKQGDNMCFQVFMRIHLKDFKKETLAEILNPKLTIEEITEMATEKSKRKFEDFYNLLSKQELGRISCYMTFTKGRFKTEIKDTKLFENIILYNHCKEALSILRSSMGKWEDLSPRKRELMNSIKGNFEGIMHELEYNLTQLEKEVKEESLSTSVFRMDAWRRMYEAVWTAYEEKIRWFLIKAETRVEEDLSQLYANITKYNDLISEAMSLGELRTLKHFENLNRQRTKLLSNVKNTAGRLAEIHSRFIPQSEKE